MFSGTIHKYNKCWGVTLVLQLFGHKLMMELAQKSENQSLRFIIRGSPVSVTLCPMSTQ